MKWLRSSMVIFLLLASWLNGSTSAGAAEGTSFIYTAEAQKLNDLGLYKGISTTSFDPDLGTALNRETGVVMLLRIFGLEADAMAITDADATLAKFTDAASISSWAKNAVAYAITNGLVQGYPDGTFGPRVALNGKAYATLILRQLGFTPDYNNAPSELADKGGLTPEEATSFAGKELVKDDLVGMSFGSLSATDKDGKKVIETLVAEKVVDEQAAADAGLVTPSPPPNPTNPDSGSSDHHNTTPSVELQVTNVLPQNGTVGVGETVSATTNQAATLYLIPANTPDDKDSYALAALGTNGKACQTTADNQATLLTTGFASGAYKLLAVNEQVYITPAVAITITGASCTMTDNDNQPLSLSESNLNGAVIRITLQGDSFTNFVNMQYNSVAQDTSDPVYVTLHNAPAGTSIYNVQIVGEQSVVLTLAYDNTNFDANVTNFSISLSGAITVSGLPITTSYVPITAVTEQVGAL